MAPRNTACAWRFQSLHPSGYPLSGGCRGSPPRMANAVIPDSGNVGEKMRISVIGTGHLGAVHAACMAELGHNVLGVDNDSGKIADRIRCRLRGYLFDFQTKDYAP
jgi:UDP-glucose/GDP-mannose dehydrogenase family, NAD binding domain